MSSSHYRRGHSHATKVSRSPSSHAAVVPMRAESLVEACVQRASVAIPSKDRRRSGRVTIDVQGLLERIRTLGDDCAMDADEAAYVLRCSVSAFRRLRLPSVRLGARLFRWRYGALRQYQQLLENRGQRNP